MTATEQGQSRWNPSTPYVVRRFFATGDRLTRALDRPIFFGTFDEAKAAFCAPPEEGERTRILHDLHHSFKPFRKRFMR
jgi:hypothetical protein